MTIKIKLFIIALKAHRKLTQMRYGKPFKKKREEKNVHTFQENDKSCNCRIRDGIKQKERKRKQRLIKSFDSIHIMHTIVNRRKQPLK